MVTAEYTINGMACAMCAGAVQKALSSTTGVESAEVNLGDKKATITYDESTITPTQLQEAVKSAGYEMVL